MLARALVGATLVGALASTAAAKADPPQPQRLCLLAQAAKKAKPALLAREKKRTLKWLERSGARAQRLLENLHCKGRWPYGRCGAYGARFYRQQILHRVRARLLKKLSAARFCRLDERLQLDKRPQPRFEASRARIDKALRYPSKRWMNAKQTEAAVKRGVDAIYRELVGKRR